MIPIIKICSRKITGDVLPCNGQLLTAWCFNMVTGSTCTSPSDSEVVQLFKFVVWLDDP